MAAAMFMNSNSLPIALMQSLVVTVPGLKWDDDDNKNSMLGRALTYLVLYSTLGMVVRWSYGVRLLAQADDEPTILGIEEESETSPLLGTANSEATLHNGDDTQATLRPQATRRRSKFYNSFPNSPNQSRVNLPSLDSEPSSGFANSPVGSDTEFSGDEDDDVLPTHNQHAHQRRSTTDSVRHSRAHSTGLKHNLRQSKRYIVRGWVALNEFMTVPLWAAGASIIVACIQPLQHTLDVHMQPLKGALASAGNCSIPLTLIVLGAYFYPSAADAEEQKSTSLLDNVRAMFNRNETNSVVKPQKDSRPGETKTVIIAVVSRMIITPLLLFPLMFLAAKFDWQEVFADPVFVVANVLLVSSPPALTLAQVRVITFPFHFADLRL